MLRSLFFVEIAVQRYRCTLFNHVIVVTQQPNKYCSLVNNNYVKTLLALLLKHTTELSSVLFCQVILENAHPDRF